MAVRIERADFADPALAAFLQAHLDDLAPTAPAESRHALDLSTLRMPQIRLWVAYDDDRIIASGALAALEPGHEELKSMRTDPSRRREGTGRRVLEHLLNDAGVRGVHRVSLETGSMDFFAAARTLYESAGFTRCLPFGDYVDDPNSVFMTKLLAD
jgi:putative acetyltransferase